jgi:hypothetical protein
MNGRGARRQVVVADAAFSEVVVHQRLAGALHVRPGRASMQQVGVPEQHVAFARRKVLRLRVVLCDLVLDGGFVALGIGAVAALPEIVRGDADVVAEQVGQSMRAGVVDQRPCIRVDVLHRNPAGGKIAERVGRHVDRVRVLGLLAALVRGNRLERDGWAAEHHAAEVHQHRVLQEVIEFLNLQVWVEVTAWVGIILGSFFRGERQVAARDRGLVSAPSFVDRVRIDRTAEDVVAVLFPVPADLSLLGANLPSRHAPLDDLRGIGLIEPWARAGLGEALGAENLDAADVDWHVSFDNIGWTSWRLWRDRQRIITAECEIAHGRLDGARKVRSSRQSLSHLSTLSRPRLLFCDRRSTHNPNEPPDRGGSRYRGGRRKSGMQCLFRAAGGLRPAGGAAPRIPRPAAPRSDGAWSGSPRTGRTRSGRARLRPSGHRTF